jgi:DNA-binding NarL/FixJ family response regulator
MTAFIKVVIADDFPALRQGVRFALEQHQDIKVVAEAATAEDVAELCRQHQPHILTLDLQMPGGTAAETINRVREASPETKVLVLTAYDDDAMIRAVMRPGVSGYLLKEEDLETIVKAVKAIHLGAAWYSQAIADKFMQWQFGREPEIGDAQLTAREHDLLTLIARGWDNAKIAKELSLSEQTIRNYTSTLYEKIGVHSRVDAVIWARERGFADDAASLGPQSARPLTIGS